MYIRRRIIIAIIVIPLILLGVRVVYGLYLAATQMSWDIYKEYLYLFPDSVQNELQTTVGSYKHGTKYVLSNFHLKDSIIIDIWELNNSTMPDLNDVLLHNPDHFNSVEKKKVEILFPDGPHEIVLKSKYNFDDGEMNVFPGLGSKIDSVFSTRLYKGFIGHINKIQLEDGSLTDMATMNFDYPREKVLFLVYKPRDKFYIITIISKKDFDLSVLNLLKLDGETAPGKIKAKEMQ